MTLLIIKENMPNLDAFDESIILNVKPAQLRNEY